jgi:hypothetical protein
MSRCVRAVLLCVCAGLLSGCYAAALRGTTNRFAVDTGCPIEQIQVTEIGGSAYQARGCGTSAVYVCAFPEVRYGDVVCTLDSAPPAPAVIEPAAETPPSAATGLPPVRPRHEEFARARRDLDESLGQLIARAELGFAEMELVVASVPGPGTDPAVAELAYHTREPLPPCDRLILTTDLETLTLAVDGEIRFHATVARFRIPLDVVAKLRSASRIHADFCTEYWNFGSGHIQALGAFLDLLTTPPEPAPAIAPAPATPAPSAAPSVLEAPAEAEGG